MAEEYDFYTMGKRYATSKLEDLKKLAQNIEREYGTDARLQFESGVAMTIPVFETFCSKGPTIDELTGTKNFGASNLRNNSYFGSEGTSMQYVYSKGKKVYNDPEEPKKGGR